ncbi:DUF928 domain-containing protein [Aerosakkonema funiforme]|uniref:DUF928 domain-containing protein n=1 Tax=Aerosakkonema funiforme TaxID=1246630 RepID=UPI0035BB2A5B
MSRVIFNRKIIAAICLTSLLTIFSNSLTMPILANDSNSGDSAEGLPGRRVGGGTRSGTLVAAKPVTALVPEDNQGLTILENPTFYFYVPKTSNSQMLEFVLNDEDGNTIYQKKFSTNGNSGVLGVELPGNGEIQPLEIGKNYRWYFAIVNDPKDRSADTYVNGWIKRVQASPDIVTKLRDLGALERAGVYADNQLWYDAIASLAQLRRSHPNDSAVEAKWKQLLHSLKLDNITQEPLIEYQASVQQSAASGYISGSLSQ